MKRIVEYLLSKSRNKMMTSVFPKEPYIYDIAEFLEEEGFKEVEDDPTLPINDLKKMIGEQMEKGNVFCVSEDITEEEAYIRIGGKGKLSKENPIFACKVFYPDADVYYSGVEAQAWIEYPGTRIPFTADTCTYDTLVDELQKHFDWK